MKAICITQRWSLPWRRVISLTPMVQMCTPLSLCKGVRALTSFLGRYYSKVIGETDIFAVRAVHENSVLYKFPSKAAADKAVKAGPIKDFNNLVVQAVRGDIGADDKVLLNTEGCFLCYVPHFTRSKK